MKYTRESIKNYEMIQCYCARNPDTKKLIPEEYKKTVDVADMLRRQVKLYEKEKKLEENQ